MNKREKVDRTALEIAVIGMAGRFPDAKNITEFWNNLKNGKESITFFSDEDLENIGIDSSTIKDPNYVKAGGFVQDVEYFDASFFSYIPAEAEIMAPQMRFFHECTWEALEDAGYDPDSYEGLIGLYAGAAPNFQWEGLSYLSGRIGQLGIFSSMSLVSKEYLTTKISYKLNFRGPSSFVHTACSTSLVAIHWACRALLNGECHMALAGAVKIVDFPSKGYMYEKDMILAPDGHCRAFDAKAKGTIPGSGIGIVVLKRLKNALKDSDHIYAVIKGTAINNDGNRKVGYTAPSVEGQAEVIRTAMAMARVDAESIGYIETHGTGTPLGDQVEFEAIKIAFNTNKKRFCGIGSVKTNIGHLDVAAGAAGFIKTVLALKHRLIPPSLHFEALNPAIDYENCPFYVVDRALQWKDNGYPLRAGVSSFGIGGTNAHVILEEAPALNDNNQIADNRQYHLIPLSAKTQSALQRISQNLLQHLTKNPGINLADMAYTLQQGRQAFQYRQVAVCADINCAIEALSTSDPGKFHSVYAKEGEKSPIFMFPGLGSQYVNMGADLYRTEPIFRREMDRGFVVLKPLINYDLKDILYPEANISTTDLQHSPSVNHIEIAQLVVFLIEYALAKLIMNYGIKPHAMIGYSLGEYTAACLSGVFSLEDALKIIVARGRLIGQLPTGTMLSVPMPAQELIPLLGPELSIAIDNGPSCIAAGPDKFLGDFQKELKEKRYLSMKLLNSHAIHSKMMEPIIKEFEEHLTAVRLNVPQIPYISNVTGQWMTAQDAIDPRYWSRHLTQTVRFADGIDRLNKEPNPIFIEIGPGRDLSTLLIRHKEKKPKVRSINLIRTSQQEVLDNYYLLSKIGHLWFNGVRIDWSKFYSNEKRYRVPLPTYPFDRHRFWFEKNPFNIIEELLNGRSHSKEKLNVEFINSLEEDIGASTQNKRMELSRPYSPPSTEIEQILVDIWENYFGIKPVGIEDDFFELGGDSLKAMTIIAEIFKESKAEIPIGEFFTRPTINKLTEYINEHAGSGTYTNMEPPKPIEQKEYYLLSSTQKRLYILQQMVRDSTSYNMPIIINLGECVEKEKLESVFKRLIKRHESLRTSFIILNEEPVQKIHKEVNFSLGYFEVKEKEDLVSLISGFINPFNLNTAPLLTAKMISMGSSRRVLFIDMHHIITDGISQGILTNEFLTFYSGEEMQPLRLQYKDYSVWHNSLSHQEALKCQEIYWMKEFPDEIPLLNLPTDYQRPLLQSFEGNKIHFEIRKEETQALKTMALSEGSTPFMVLMTIYNILLFKLSGQDDIVIGIPVAGRRLVDLEKIIGMFVNTLSLRNYPLGERVFRKFLGNVKEKTLMAFENQEYPFEELVDKLSLKRDIGRNPLFDVMFVWQSINTDDSLGQDKNTDFETRQLVQPDSPKEYENIFQTTKFDLTLTAMERGHGLSLSFQYCTKLFKKETIERFIYYFKKIVSIAVKEPDIRLSEIEILSQGEKNRILDDFNQTRYEYPKDKTIQRLFEEQVERTPDNIAVLGPILSESEKPLDVFMSFNAEYSHHISYCELNEKSSRLSYVLQSKGVVRDTIIGIMVERSVEMIIGIMGILKAGGAYLPIDPEYPKDRINFIIKDSGAKGLFVNSKFSEEGEKARSWEWEKNPEILSIEPYSSLSHQDLDIPDIPTSHQFNLAYLIYTSGSTRGPRGVMVEHRNVVNLIYSMKKVIYQYESPIAVALVSPIYFDASIKQIFSTLTLGHRLVIVSEPERIYGEKLILLYKKYRIIVSDGTPAHLALLLETMQSLRLHKKFPVQKFVIGGDVLKSALIEQLLKNLCKGNDQNELEVVNVYGPTECCDVTSTFTVHKAHINQYLSIPIGKPINNVKVYIIGKAEKPQPIGVVGELYISGAGVARGYLNHPELTAEKFIQPQIFTDLCRFILESHIPHFPTHPLNDSTIYRSGDLARWMHDGNIEFLGRIDYQVKIRGFRIELGEIENCLLKVSGVKEAVALALEEDGGGKYICAYFVSDSEYEISEIRGFMSKELPNYMIPSYFVRLEKIPLTPNGKIDRRALPVPKIQISEGYTAPSDDIEKKLAEIWSEVLVIEKEKIGIESNFFELGGHSLKATIIVSKIHKEFEVRVPLAEIFKAPRLKALAELIKGRSKDIYISIKSVEKKEYYPLSSAQKRLYILQQMQLEGTAYNMPQFIPLEMSCDLTKTEDTFKKLIARHENFRTTFNMVNEEPVQRVHDEVKFEILHHQVPADGAIFTPGSLILPFDLARVPLLRVGLVKPMVEGTATKNRHGHTFLFVDMHHIISDGVSHEILVKDFLSLYEGEELLPLRIQYKDFSLWQNGEKEREKIRQQKSYWLKEFAGEIPVLELPTDYPRPLEQSFEGNNVNFEITGEKIQILKAIALAEGSTLFMVLLAIYNILLSKLSGQEEIIIGTPIAGRRHPDLENIIGMFVNTLLLRNYPAGEQRFRDFFGEVKEKTLMAFENQEYPFEDLVDNLSVKRDIERNPLFDTMFVLQNIDANLEGQDKEIEIETKRLIQSDSLEEYENVFQTAKFDLTLTAVEKGYGLLFSFQYCTKLFKKESIERFIVYFKKILSTVVNEPSKRLNEIEIISDAEKNLLLYEFNDTEMDYPKDKTIHQLFEEQVEVTPDNIAVIGPSLSTASHFNQLSCRKLNERSNRLSHELQTKGVTFDVIVGIMADRSVEMVIGIMGILKSNGAYIPIDPNSPEERKLYMLKDSYANILLTGQEIADLDSQQVLRICRESTPSATSHLNMHPPPVLNTSLAYVIYTSGSTGKPKGVLVEHRNVVNTVTWFVNTYKLGRGTNILQLSDYTFDASVNQIFGSLITGSTLYIPKKEIRLDIVKLREYIIYNKINLINFVPIFLKELLCYGDKLKSLHTVISGAEKLDETTKNAIIRKGYRLFNQYGPTEATIDTLSMECSWDKVSLGKPIFNVKVYILGKNEKILPIKVSGELYISGAGIARGYMNRQELTIEKFIIRHPSLSISSPKNTNKQWPSTNDYLYKTGDLARWLHDGNIEFLGRIDHQVKIRGYRIELGEIESCLLRVNGVKEAVVLAREEERGDKYLCTYFVSDREYQVSELREFLSEELPEYMIPSYFVQVEKIPITANGKIDRKALNSIGIEKKSRGEYVAPRNEIEQKITQIWKEVLKIEKVGIDENFFDIGGTSLSIIRINAKFKEVFNEHEIVVQMFRYPTIRSFGEYLIQKRDGIISLNNVHRPVPINQMKQARQNQKSKRLKGGFSND